MARDANAICDRCGFQRKLSALRKEWNGLMTCAECWDPAPRTLSDPHIYPEGLPLPNARPEPTAVVLDDEDPVEPGDL